MSDQYDLIIIGSGPGGYVAAIKASQEGLKTAIVEKAELGGVCLNWGCIPTKALLKSAELLHYFHDAESYGLKAKNVGADFKAVIERSRQVAAQNSQGVQYLMKKNKVDVIQGAGRLLAKGLVEVSTPENGKKNYSCRHVLIATGASARQFPQFPIDGEDLITYRQALALTDQPKRMLIIGAGAIGVEFAYFFNSLGTEVHLVEMLPQLLPVEDEESAKLLEASFKKQGIQCYTSATVENVKVKSKGKIQAQITVKGKEPVQIEVGRVLVAVGMLPNTKNLGLETSGVRMDPRGFIQVDEFQQTSVPGVYAIGDVCGKQLLAHKASAEGEVAVAHIKGKAEKGLDYSQIPGCTYCQPQVASVGATEKALKERNIAYIVGKFPFSASGKARAIGHTEGQVKLLFGKQYGELLGAHIVGSEATELLAELGLAMKLESTYKEIMETVHAHPTLSEAVMEAAFGAAGHPVHI